MNLDEARDLLVIDKMRLEDEVSFQPEYFWQVAYESSIASSKRDFEKSERDRIWSILFLTKKSENVGGKSPTDTAVKALVETSAEYVDADRAYLTAKAEAENWSGMKESWQQRATMLRELCSNVASGNFEEMTIKASASKLDAKSYAEAKKKLREG